MPEIEIVDDLFKPVQNPHEDRITAILQKRAQPAPQMISPQEFDAYGIGNIASRTGPQQFLDAINGLQNQREDRFYQSQDREYQTARGLYDLFEEKRNAGDKQAQALFDKISLFTGGDPEGTALFVEALHNDPERIDPGNAFQVMTKLAGIAKKTGYRSLDTRAKEAQIRASNALSAQRSGSGGTRKLMASEQKELFNLQDTMNAGQNVIGALDKALSLNTQAVSGFGAGTRRDIGRNAPILGVFPGIPDQEEVVSSTELENIVTGQALESLKAIFGGMPTEGERKILLEMQGSLNKSPGEREVIFRRAQEMAANKLLQNQARAEQIITGNYQISPGIKGTNISGAINAQDDSDLLNYMTPEERALFGQ